MRRAGADSAAEGGRAARRSGLAAVSALVADRAYARRAGAFAAFMFGLGLLWHALPATSGLVRPLTPYMLLLFGLAALAPLAARLGFRAVAWMAGSYAAGFALEAVGVATGLVFGPYEYSSALGAKVLGVPPIIGFNWVVVTAGSAEAAAALVGWAASRLAPQARPAAKGGSGVGDGPDGTGAPKGGTGRLALSAVAAGLIAAGFDWVMEPAAVALGYWKWLAPSIPARNYLAWFAFAAASGAALLASMRAASPRKAAPGVAKATAAPRPLGFAPGFASAYAAVQAAFFVGIRILDYAGLLR